MTNTDKSIEERLQKVLNEQFDMAISPIVPTAKLFEDLGLDSLDQVELLLAIEEEFHIASSDPVTEDKMYQVRTYNEMLQLLTDVVDIATSVKVVPYETPITDAAINCPLYKHHDVVSARVPRELEQLTTKLKTAMSQLMEMYQTPVENWRENPERQQRKQTQMYASYGVAMTAWNELHAVKTQP